MLDDSFRPRRSPAGLCETNLAGSRARRIENPPQVKNLSAWPCRATKVDENQCWTTVFDHVAHRLRSAKRTLQEAEQGGLKIRRRLKTCPTRWRLGLVGGERVGLDGVVPYEGLRICFIACRWVFRRVLRSLAGWRFLAFRPRSPQSLASACSFVW